MGKHYTASVLLITLVMLSGLLALIFMAKESLADRNKITLNLTQDYLIKKMSLINNIQKNPQALCQQFQTENIRLGDYGFHCQLQTIFKQGKQTKRHILVERIEDWLDLEKFNQGIYTIRSLSELPQTAVDNPKIVRVLNPINERLTQHFYGIIITEYPFDITDKRIFGQIYSTVNNDRGDRDFIYRSQIIDQLAQQFSYWHYLPHSKYYANHSTAP